jgi:hypothetical protein
MPSLLKWWQALAYGHLHERQQAVEDHRRNAQPDDVLIGTTITVGKIS